MKLIHYTIRKLSVVMIIILTAWAALFSFNIFEEVWDETDDSLENFKILIIRQFMQDTTTLNLGDKDLMSQYHIREITEKEAQRHPRKNLITKALGVNKTVTCDYNRTKIQKNDIIMLCTDGLTNYLTSEKIKNILLQNDLESAVEILVDQAKNLGGNDNITVSVIEI